MEGGTSNVGRRQRESGSQRCWPVLFLSLSLNLTEILRGESSFFSFKWAKSTYMYEPITALYPNDFMVEVSG